MILFFAILAAFIAAPSGALAEPISSAIAIALAASSAGAGTFAAIAAGFGALGAFATRIIVGAGLSLLSQAFAKKPKVNGQGIQTEQTTTGDVTPAKFVVGTYAVEGHAVAPAYSRFKNNGILTYILEVSNVPVTGLTGRIVINGKYSDIEAPANSAGPFNEVFTGSGRRILTAFRQDDTDPTAWLWFYDGTQTTAAAPLVHYYEHHVDRPWTTAHVLRGTAYAVLEFALDPEIYQGLPSVRFEVRGIKLYDPRKDTTVGGSGAHRWDDPTTWEWTENPIVINYNVMRGITLPTGDVWGGRVDAEDLPLDNWFAAMNECDVDVGGRKQYVAGFEINVEEMEPVDVIEEMNRACFAQMSEFGGVFRVRVGAPAAPVLHVTDADFVITEGSVLTPFPAFDTVTNGITGTYVEPNDIWEGRDADLILNEDWVAEDGRQRVSSLGLPAVSVKAQAQQLLNAYLLDGRRFRTHQMTLPPSFALVEPLDSISFTSEAFGYTSKVFEVIEVEDRTDTLLQVVTVREREAGDVAIKPELEVAAPLPTNGQTPPTPAVVALSVAAFDLSDDAGNARRPAILLTWTVDDAFPSIRNLRYEVRVRATLELIAEGIKPVEGGRVLVRGDVIAATEYEVRARYVADAPTAWSPWLSVTTPDLRMTDADLDPALTTVTVPAGLALTTTLVADAVSRVSAVWGAVANAVSYEVGVTTGGTETIFPAGGPAWSREGVPGTVFSIRVRAVSAIGTKSAWSAAVGITAAVDTIPPAVPSGITAEGMFEGIWVKWTANTESDLSRYEIVERVSATAPGVSTMPTYITTTPQFISQNLTGGQTLNYWVRAVDTSGNKSGWSARVTATARATGDVINQEALQGLIDATSFAAGLEPVTVVASLPAVKSTELVAFGGKIYRWNGTAYIASVASTDVVGQFTAASIAAGAIGADQLAVNAVRARNMAIGSFDNLNIDANFDDHSAWSNPTGVDWITTAAITSWGSTNLARLQGVGTTYTVSNSLFTIELNGEGETLYFRYFARIVAGTGNVYADLQLSRNPSFSGVNGTDYIFANIGTVSSTSITKVEGAINVPAGYKFARIRLIKGNNGTTNCYIGGVMVRRMNTGKLIVDGEIQSNHINTGSFAAAGLALFGDALQSDDFSAGSIGWQINKNGSAEFNSLIVRSSLVEGSVSDGGTALSTAAQHVAHNSVHCLTTLSSGDATPESMYTIGTFFEHRPAGTSAFDGRVVNTAFLLQERISFAGSWSAWANLYNSGYAIGGIGATYTQRHFVTNRIYNADSVQLRLLTVYDFPTGGLSTTQNCLRNAAISLRAVRR